MKVPLCAGRPLRRHGIEPAPCITCTAARKRALLFQKAFFTGREAAFHSPLRPLFEAEAFPRPGRGDIVKAYNETQNRRPADFHRRPPACFICFSKTPPRGCAGESKKVFAVSSGRSGMYSIPKRGSTQREEAHLRKAGQVMQKTEHSVLLERLAFALEEHTQAPGFAGGLTLNMRRRCYSRGAFSARMAFRMASTITPTSANTASHILAMPSAPSTSTSAFTASANTMF